MRLIYSILFLYLFIGIVSNLKSNESFKYEMQLKDGRVIQLKSFKIEKDEKILFTDINDLERIIGINEIQAIVGIYEPGEEIDCIVKHDSLREYGRIIEYKPGEFILIKKMDMNQISVPINDISGLESMSIDEIPSSMDDYFEIGVNLGFPAAVNAYLGYANGLFGIHCSGMHIYLADGFQLNLALNLYDSKVERHSIALAGGISNIRKDKWGSGGLLNNFHWEYIGLVYNLYYRGLWTEIGLSYGKGDYSNTQPVFQFGYVYRFIN